MAKLDASSATIQIIPYSRETPTSDWIDTVIILEYHLLGKAITFDFSTGDISVRTEEFHQMINGIKAYINSLPMQSDALSKYRPKDFYFSPLEPSFALRVGSGYFKDKEQQEGVVFVDFRVGLRILSVDELVGDSIGCVVQVTVQSLMDFLTVLEHDVESVVQKQ